MAKILIVEDDLDISYLIKEILEDHNHVCQQALDVQTAQSIINESALKEERIDCVILDIWLRENRMDGMTLLRWLRKEHHDVVVIMISGHASNETAAIAIKFGAFGFLEKPFKSDKLLLAVKRALEYKALNDNNLSIEEYSNFNIQLSGKSRYILDLRKKIYTIANSNSRVFIFGAPASGKLSIARLIHTHSKRKKKKFMHLDSGFLSDNRDKNLAQEADRGDRGDRNYSVNLDSILSQCDGGTLCLDNIEMISHENQRLLLNSLQNTLQSNSNDPESKDVRIIATTTYDPEQLIAKGFDETLIRRLAIETIETKNLCEYIADLPEIARTLVRRIADKFRIQHVSLTYEILQLLSAHKWSYNMQELHHVIEHIILSMLRANRTMPSISDVPQYIRKNSIENVMGGSAAADLMDGEFDDANLSCISSDINFRDAKIEFERKYIMQKLIQYRYNITITAQNIGIHRTALYKKLKLLKLTDMINEEE